MKSDLFIPIFTNLLKGGERIMPEEKKISGWQIFMDDISMLFLLGVVIPTVLYVIWGVMEYAFAPTFSLPPGPTP